jgi:hypothetical protein
VFDLRLCALSGMPLLAHFVPQVQADVAPTCRGAKFHRGTSG